MTDRYLIKKIRARWILDSRGFPTIETDVITEDGVVGRAAVPSGASTGEHEVLELRDRNNRFMGRGVNKAIENVNLKIAKLLLNQNVLDQSSLDQSMIELDGTKNKSNLGGNAILSVSLAIADAAAKELNIELFEYLYKIYRENDVPSIKYVLPVPMSNVLNGGKHAGKSAINLGDEGGFAPNLSFTKDALNLLIDAIEESGYNKGKEISIAIDAAASEFYNGSKYLIDEKRLSIEELIDYYIDLVKTYPIISIEDPFDENDFQAHSKLMSKINIQIVGDDLFVTQVDRIKRGIEEKSANALLLKVNQVGTLTEALNSAKLCQKNNFNVIVSHRSGETENTFISDLAVGLSFNRGLIKAGAPARSERTAKYNRILRIEEKIQNSIYSGKNFK